ncbi:MAG: lipid II flippase MurJ, partial [Lysinibacillus sp.]
QMYIMIQRFYTNMLDDGIVSAMNSANKMSQFPQAILMTAVTTVIFPILAKKEAEGDQAAVKSVYIRGLRMLYLLILPVSLYFFFESESVVRLLFERANFDEVSTAMTAPLVALFSLTMFFLAANVYVTRFYYAKGNSNIPVVFGLISVFAVNIFIINLMIEDYGADAIAYATLISSIVNFILLVGYLQWKYSLKIVYNNIGQLLKFALITILTVAAFYTVSQYIEFESKWLHSLVTGCISFSIYFGILVALRVQELGTIVTKVKNKVKSKK